MTSRRFAPLAVALICAACRVGQPLVDENDGDLGIFHIECSRPPPCIALTAMNFPRHPAMSVNYECAQDCVWESSTGDARDSCPTEPLQTLPRSAQCMDVDVAPATGASELNLSEVNWEDLNLSLRADEPLQVVLTGGKLQRVFIELRGPITLRIEQVKQLADLRITGSMVAAGAPRVELVSLGAQHLSVGSAENPFPGELTLQAAWLSDIDAYAAALTFESGVVEQASLRADSIALSDVTLRLTLVEAKVALWSAFIAQDSSLRLCGDTRLFSGQMVRCALSTCPDSSLRMFGSEFNSGSLDGRFELAETNMTNVALAPNTPTRVLAYGSHLTANQLCSNLELLALSADSDIKCSGCVDRPEDEMPACMLAVTEDMLLDNYCPAWKELDQLPQCAEDLPANPHRVR